MPKKILPVLLGADLNCYSVARAFHEAYGVRSYAFGKSMLGEISHSKIIKFIKVEELEKEPVLCRTLIDFAKAHSEKELFLVPCTDEYALSVSKAGEELGKYYFFACPEKELAQSLSQKDNFYRLCMKYGIPIPQTEIFFNQSDFSLLDNLPFPYPIIIKPSCSAEYWHAPFDGMKKVYTAQSAEQAKNIISKIFSSGYKSNIILQELIPANEDDVFVLTTYSDKKARVRAACMGHVLLGEHTPKGLGNHVAIVTEHHPEITEKLCSFLEDIGYRGFANFDILSDKRSGGFTVLELNIRQGRSNYYMTSAGMNVAQLLVKDSKNELPFGRIICRKSVFWHTVPKRIIYNYITESSLLKKARKLAKEGNESTSLFYRKDLFLNPLRTAYVCIHNTRYFGKYKKYR